MAAALGFDEQDEELVQRLLGWYRDIVDSVAGVAAGRLVTDRGAAAMAALRAELTPSLPDAAAVSNVAVLLFGGIETTEGLILNAVRHVLIDTPVRDEVIADLTLVGLAVEESLRLEPAAAVVDRYATRDVELAGGHIRAGNLVVVSLAAANRDPAEFPDPDRFDLRRPNLRRQLAFATGSHVCLGMDLARLEATTALGAVLTRLPGVRLDDDAPPPTGLVFRKPDRLPVRW
jgi:cytochrome P450